VKTLKQSAAEAFVKFNADNEWSLSQVQGFRYGQDHVVRDCMLPGDRQEIWRRPVSDTSPEDMRDFIDLYRAQQAMDAVILALRQWLEDEGLVVVPREETDKMVFAAEDVLALSRRGGAVSQTLVSPAAGIWEAMIAAAPDALAKDATT
jgi:hypothetical protein